MNAKEKLQRKTSKALHICVGLDSDLDKIPKHLRTAEFPLYEFNLEIIEATKNDAAAYKINLAFYEARGNKGLRELEKTLAKIPSDVLTIGDAKRGDIGNTSRMYARALFDELGFDASTLNPLMGRDSLSPFLEYSDKLHFVLGLTSNVGANDFEKLRLENGKFLFQQIIETVKTWGDNVGFVFGATNTDELKRNIKLLENAPALLPGVGAQGGSLEETVKTFYENGNSDFIVNISRGLIYLDSTEKFAYFTEERLKQLNATVKSIAEKYGETNK